MTQLLNPQPVTTNVVAMGAGTMAVMPSGPQRRVETKKIML